MAGHERRTASRDVIGGLTLEIGGVSHETLDVSNASVAIIREAGVDYARLNAPARFCAPNAPQLNQDIRQLHFITRRSGLIVLGYELGDEMDQADWEAILKAHDVRADMKQLEDVFG